MRSGLKLMYPIETQWHLMTSCVWHMTGRGGPRVPEGLVLSNWKDRVASNRVSVHEEPVGEVALFSSLTCFGCSPFEMSSERCHVGWRVSGLGSRPGQVGCQTESVGRASGPELQGGHP